MKSIIILFFILSLNITAQEFTVDKITGTVKVLRETSENWDQVTVGQKLNASDLLMTDKKSTVKLKRAEEIFVLTSNVALGLNHIKKVSVNDLILALTLDEIRNVPKNNKNHLSKNTAIYGSEEKSRINISEDEIGFRKLNGAKLLNENGYTESSIIAAKEVFRNYPKTALIFSDRLYFADLLAKLELYQEALSEYEKIENLTLMQKEKEILDNRKNEMKTKLIDY